MKNQLWRPCTELEDARVKASKAKFHLVCCILSEKQFCAAVHIAVLKGFVLPICTEYNS